MNELKSRYRFGDEIGKGGFGTVYSGTRIETDETVAIKVCEPDRFEDGVPTEAAFLTKAASVSGVARLVEYAKIDRSRYVYVMHRPNRCVDLYDYVDSKADRRLSESEAKRLFKQVIVTVKELFDVGIVHGDIKDENVVIDLDTGKTYLIDFGAATHVASEPYTEFNGTIVSAPPEWIGSKKYRAEPSTVWSCGVLLHVLVTGVVPFETKREICAAKLHPNPRWSEPLVDLMSGMLAYEQSERPTLANVLCHKFLQ